MTSKIQGARERARSEIISAIKSEARRQLAAEGAARLSLRAVARELGMVSSALYRYFPSRDDLLTALITDAYDMVGGAAEEALAAAESVADSHLARWQAVCRAVRAWALAHPHEYALIYGSPVPGYAAPPSTTAPASRVGLALIAVARDAYATGALQEPARGWAAPEAAQRDAAQLMERLGVRLPAPVAAELIAAWAQLFGLVSFELFGQFSNVVSARDAFFEHAATRLADQVGLGAGSGVLRRE
ncbi:TetR/AcrR family transcriptional regulator [Streptomyces iconiensis]|uniref:TetR/AcrR family transcriptional regulator n=1 Tax=Streptomyces iconiensis TaxID=1384038 RepID=A0ABT6ZRF5_9ACTN|nr:TetR/AcrR family transcriptional regulator [Streptomyces iconiensis]MDJ1131364.1 TetR/AcrR family transcriptional regulator [Streptomyces iconiensis]